ncbi:hypothetical protein HMI55_005371, partial [Coelomomyces lativittatus]
NFNSDKAHLKSRASLVMMLLATSSASTELPATEFCLIEHHHITVVPIVITAPLVLFRLT